MTIVGSNQNLRPTGTARSQQTREEPQTEWWKVEYEIESPHNELLDGITRHTAICVTDGSYKNGRGTAAYILKSSIDSNDSNVYVNQTPGHEEAQDPFRAELAGIYGCIQTVTDLAKKHNVNGTIELGCDCTSALRNSFEHKTVKPAQPHADLVQAVQKALKDSHLEWKWRYVKAHQDDKRKWHQLDSWERLNVQMDTTAKSYW